MRRGWERKGKCYYYIAAFLIVFTLQAAFSLIVNASALYISLYSTSNFSVFDVIGTIVWLIGFSFEVIGDY